MIFAWTIDTNTVGISNVSAIIFCVNFITAVYEDAIAAAEENQVTEKNEIKGDIVGAVVFVILVGGTAFLIFKAVRRHSKSEENK